MATRERQTEDTGGQERSILRSYLLNTLFNYSCVNAAPSLRARLRLIIGCLPIQLLPAGGTLPAICRDIHDFLVFFRLGASFFPRRIYWAPRGFRYDTAFALDGHSLLRLANFDILYVMCKVSCCDCPWAWFLGTFSILRNWASRESNFMVISMLLYFPWKTKFPILLQLFIFNIPKILF